MKKKILTILILIIILLVFSIPVYAAAPNSNFWQRGKKWIELGKDNQNNLHGATPDWTPFNDLAGVLWGIGVFIVAIGGTILGIKYVFSSVEEKASIKESMKPYIIGAVMILGALTIWKILVELLGNM